MGDLLDWCINAKTAHELFLLSTEMDIDPDDSPHSYQLEEDSKEFDVTVFNKKQSLVVCIGQVKWYFYNKVVDGGNDTILPDVSVIVGRKDEWEIFIGETGLKFRDLIYFF